MKANIQVLNLNDFIKDLNKWEKEKTLELDKEIKKHALMIESKAKVLCPTDFSILKTSIRSRFQTLGADVYTGVEYAPHVEFGTRPHIIEAKDKKVLYSARGKKFFGKRVMHPGTKAQPFLFPAWNEVRPKLIEAIKRLLNKK